MVQFQAVGRHPTVDVIDAIEHLHSQRIRVTELTAALYLYIISVSMVLQVVTGDYIVKTNGIDQEKQQSEHGSLRHATR